MGGEDTGSLGSGPQGPAQTCSEVMTKLIPPGCLRGEVLGQWVHYLGSHFTCHTSPGTAQGLPAASQLDGPLQTQGVSRPNSSQSQRVACGIVPHLHFSNHLCPSRTLFHYRGGVFLTSHSIKNDDSMYLNSLMDPRERRHERNLAKPLSSFGQAK